MSATCGVDAGSSIASQWAQQAQEQQRAGWSDARAGSRAGAFKAQFEEAATAAGADPAKLPDLEKQIQAAAQKAGSEPGNRRAAIDQVLQQNGVDPAKFRSAIESASKAGGAHKGGHHHGHKAKPAGDSEQPASADSPLGGDPAAANASGVGGTVDLAA